MKRDLRADEAMLWSKVAQTVHPLGARRAPGAAYPPPTALELGPPPPSQVQGTPKSLEPGRLRRLARGHDPAPWSLDLHGLTQEDARAALFRFLQRAQSEGLRAVTVVTGRGLQGDGVLRRRTPEWLAEPHLRDLVAGVGEAHRRHGGAGALYVALKRRKSGP